MKKFKRSIRSKMAEAGRELGIDMSRREFMRKTMEYGCAAGMLPYLMDSLIMHKVAHAEPRRVAYLGINMRGGSAMQNWFPCEGPGMLAAGALKITANRSDLFSLANGGRAIDIGDPSVMNKLPFMVNDNPWTAGLRAGVSNRVEILIKLLYAMVCSVTNNDTNQNKHGLLTAFTKAGYTGLLAPVVRADSSPSGIGAQNLVSDQTSTSLFARTVGSMVNAARFLKGATVPGAITDANFLKLAQGLARLEAAELGSLGSSVNQEFATIQNGAYSSLPSISQVPPGATNALLNLGLNPTIATDLGVAPANQNDGFRNLTTAQAIRQQMAYFVLSGFAAAGWIEVGGYDYHNVIRQTVDQREYDVGLLVGQAIAAAYDMDIPLLVALTTDGSAAGDDNEHPVPLNAQKFRGDAASVNRTLLFCIDKQGGYELVNGTIGKVNFNTGISDSNTLVSSASGAAAATFATYLAMTDRLGELNDILAGSGLESTDLTAIAALRAFQKRST